ncbi:MAG: hypothetical protein QGG36_06345 [Pirellulaceae bacterium]|jgi:hypothetical protein|nr:hypothetical protein [Pirellulaceae bacterium]MDP7015398.1 hypothetical protein [Pirellulaceae bacterium]
MAQFTVETAGREKAQTMKPRSYVIQVPLIAFGFFVALGMLLAGNSYPILENASYSLLAFLWFVSIYFSILYRQTNVDHAYQTTALIALFTILALLATSWSGGLLLYGAIGFAMFTLMIFVARQINP